MYYEVKVSRSGSTMYWNGPPLWVVGQVLILRWRQMLFYMAGWSA